MDLSLIYGDWLWLNWWMDSVICEAFTIPHKSQFVNCDDHMQEWSDPGHTLSTENGRAVPDAQANVGGTPTYRYCVWHHFREGFSGESSRNGNSKGAVNDASHHASFSVNSYFNWSQSAVLTLQAASPASPLSVCVWLMNLSMISVLWFGKSV